ncbi:hypothetical protein OG625_35520 [Streptomyces sp. NBC_01351]|uniref:hypothetical protein n=1 Tax=Streptomyces sp. NBC_01351 TaxID=2903833 RepID=UPI002E361726|nr:hypothetical protein [Streptomyces sp. NBC_01351]
MTMPFASDARYRTPYEAELHALLAERFLLDGSQTVLGLGLGPEPAPGEGSAGTGPRPGAPALSLAALVDHVYVVHPDPAVLAEGSRLAEERGRSNVSWLEGDTSAVTRLCLPRIDLCVIGGVHPQMDLERLAADLDTLLAPRGAIVLMASPDELEEPADRLAKSVFSRAEIITREQRPVAFAAIIATRPGR